MDMHYHLTRISKKYNFRILLALLQILEKMDRKRRRYFWLVSFLEVFSGLLESLATVWVAVFAAMFTNIEGLANNMYLNLVFRFFSISIVDEKLRALSFVAAIMFVMLVVKNISFSVSSYFRGKYLMTVETALKSEAMKRYLEKPYKWFLDRKESDLLQNIEWIGKIRMVLNYVIISFSNFTTMVTLFLVLIFYSYAVSLSAILVLSLAGGSAYRYIRNYIERNEKIMRNNLSMSNSAKHDIIYDYKNIKINSVGESFYRRFIEPLQSNISKEAAVSFLQSSPMFVFEILGFGIITFITIFMPVFLGWTTSQTMHYISLIAVTAWRIIPAMNRFVSNQAKLRTLMVYVEPVFDAVYDTGELEAGNLAAEENQMRDGDCPEIGKISFRNVSFSYGRDMETVIKNLTLDIYKEDKVGVIGVSGSGKTTFIDLFCGILQPDEGSITLDAEVETGSLLWRKKISYLPQSVRLFPGTLERNVVFGYSEKIDTEKLARVYKWSILEEVENRGKDGESILLSSMNKNLSGGQVQRLGIARLLYRDTEVLIIDEGTASLDRLTEKKILDNIFSVSRNKLVLMVTHHFDNLSYCNKILAFTGNRGIIFGDKYDVLPQIRNNPDFFYDDEETV